MPVYEFYCPDCHVLFSFLSRRVSPGRRPACPRCGRPELERRPSRFAVSRGRTEEADDGGLPDLDEARLERAMEALAREGQGMDDEDPRQAARMMKTLYEAAGMELGGGMEEAIRRMESGEDPDKIEEELGDLLEEEDPFQGSTRKGGLQRLRRKFLPPEVDPRLYEL